jgi:outer membrane protein assembly factor BamB
MRRKRVSASALSIRRPVETREKWKAAASSLDMAYGTPSVATLKGGSTELVVAVPGVVWGLNLKTGKLRWFAEHALTGNICPSVVADGELVYVFGGFRSAGSLALQAGGKDDVTKSHLKWSNRTSSYVATPVLFKAHLSSVLDRRSWSGLMLQRDVGRAGLSRTSQRHRRRGRPVYASPVVAGGKVYVPTRWNGVVVLPAKPKCSLETNSKATTATSTRLLPSATTSSS